MFGDGIGMQAIEALRGDIRSMRGDSNSTVNINLELSDTDDSQKITDAAQRGIRQAAPWIVDALFHKMCDNKLRNPNFFGKT
jgi:hypothetical protein